MGLIYVNCLNCKKEFQGNSCENPKFCSRSCSAQVTNRTNPKRSKIERTCKKCETKFIPEKRQITYCKACFAAKDR